MKINFKDTNNQLWNETACTIPFVTTKATVIDRTPRFNLFSIYHKDDVNKPKKVFSQFEKPQLLLLNFRRQIQQATHSVKYQKHYASMDTKHKNKHNNKQKHNPEPMDVITNKLYQIPDKFDFKYDKFGNRSNLVGNYNVKEIIEGKSLGKKSFTSGRRTDLSRPYNFYPGPGTYFDQSLRSKASSTFLPRQSKQIKPQAKYHTFKQI